MRSSFWRIVVLTLRGELGAIAGSPATLLVLLGGVVGYGVLYNLLYEPNVVREAPVVVVDESHSHPSYTLTELIDASPSAQVVGVCGNPAEGRQWLLGGKAEAMIYLPHDFEQRLGRGEEALFVAFSTTSSLLYYEATAGAIAEATLALGERTRSNMVWSLPEEVRLALANRQSVTTEGFALFNPSKGYADYLIPVVLIVILFQTMVMVVSMVAGGRRERHRSLLGRGHTKLPARMSIVASRSALYVGIYAICALLLIGLLPRLFSLPNLAPVGTLISLLTPFLIATSLFAQAFGRLFGDGDAAVLYITFFSVGLIFLSGVSYPFAEVPTAWHIAYYLLPAPSAIVAFVEANSMGASTYDLTPHLATLWLQALAYFLLASLPKRGFR